MTLDLYPGVSANFRAVSSPTSTPLVVSSINKPVHSADKLVFPCLTYDLYVGYPRETVRFQLVGNPYHSHSMNKN